MATMPGTLAFSLFSPESSARRFFTSSTTGAATPTTGARFSASTPCRRRRILRRLIGALLMAAWYMRRHHMPVLRTTDGFAPGLAFGHVLGRFGCFSADAVTANRRITSGLIFHNPLANSVSGTPLGVRIEPTQLIEAAAEFFNFLLLSWLLTRKKFDDRYGPRS